jgi:5,10-methylenetetrahydrofolate reductase
MSHLSRLQQGIQRGEFLITAEVMPPKGGNPAAMLQMARLLDPWVHGINVTDGSRAVLRMSSLAAASLLQQHHLEPIYQIACRDRNRIALQADLMGASALGIRNVLALTGDPVSVGDQPQAKAVYDYESVRLLQVIQKLNQGLDSENQPLPDGALNLFPGAAVDPQSGSWSGLQRRFERKLQAGAQFFQSQMIVDFDRLEKFMTQIAQGCGRPILAGIFLLKSAKNARYINKHVPGVNIPEALIQRLERAAHPLEEGIRIASEQVQWAQQLCQGVHLMAVKREDLIPVILSQAGLSPTNPDRYTPPAPADPRGHGATPAGERPEK